MMTTFQKVAGNITLTGEHPAQQKPLGLLVEIYKRSSDHPENLLWLGSAKVDTSGNFMARVLSDSISDQNLVLKVYNNQYLVKEHNVGETSVENILLQIKAAAYDTVVPDDALIQLHADYMAIRGSVTLGEAPIAAIPYSGEDWTIVLNKVAFRNNIAIAATTIDAFGKFEIKIPYRFLYLEAGKKDYNAIPKLSLELIHLNAVSVASSDTIVVEGTTALVDISISDPDYKSEFHTEFDVAEKIISDVAGIAIEELYTITISELDALKTISGLASSIVTNIVTASRIAHDYAVKTQAIYALVRAGYSDIAAICSLTPDFIASILTKSIADHIIEDATDINDTNNHINEIRIGQTGELETTEGDPLRSILSRIVSDVNAVDTFLKLYLNSSDAPTEDFWTKLIAEIGPEYTSRFQRGIQAMALTGMRAEMIVTVLDAIGEDDIDDFASGQTESTWFDFIYAVCDQHKKLCVPKSIRGDVSEDAYADEEVITTYAEKLYDISSKIFATNVIKTQLLADYEISKELNRPAEVISFLESRPDFDFRTHNIWNEAVEVHKETQQDLLALQNVSRLSAGNISIMSAMLQQGIKSSSQVVAMGETLFIDLINEAQPEKYVTEAKAVFAKALQTDLYIKQSYIQLLPGNYSEKVTQTWSKEVWAKESQPSVQYSYPDLESLFGSMDFCSCSDCSSMYSPSAYFTDVFNFIKTKIGNANAEREVSRRRSDLSHIDLSCKNANTPMPYIDLVNEILELSILRDIKQKDPGESTLVIPDSFQTSATAAELEAYPEHTYKDSGVYKDYSEYTKVYDKRLSKAIYPNTLPFNLALEESKVFLQHLGHERGTLMDLWKPKSFQSSIGNTGINAYTTAAESLNISVATADIITNTVIANTWLYYGFNTEPNWHTNLCNDLETLLTRTKIEYKEFLQLITTTFLNPLRNTNPAARGFAVVAKAGKPVDTCALEDLKLEYRPAATEDVAEAQKAFFKKLHRFVRLYKATKWSVYQLDIVLRSFNATDIDAETLIHIATAQQWSIRYGIAPERLSILWSPIDVTRYINFNSSLQEEMPSVYDTLFRNRGIINPTDTHFGDYNAISGTIAENAGTILATYNITEEDLYASLGGPTNVATTLENLSEVYRKTLVYKLLSNTLETASYKAFEERCILFDMVFPNGTANNMIAGWAVVFEQLNRIKSSLFSWDELMFLLIHKDPSEQYATNNAGIQTFLEQLRRALKQTLGSSDLTQSSTEIASLKEKLKKHVIQQFTAQFNGDYNYTNRLLDSFIELLSPVGSVLDAIVSNTFINNTDPIDISGNIPGFMDFFNFYRAYHIVAKASFVANKLKTGGDLSILLQEEKPALGTFAVDDFRVVYSGSISSDQINAFLAYTQWIQLRDTNQLNDTELIKLIRSGITTTTTHSVWVQTLSQQFNWTLEELQYLLGNGGSNTGILGYTFDPVNPANNDYKEPSLLLQLNAIFKASQKLGLSIKSIYESLLPAVSTAQSQTIRKAAKAKQEIEQWYKIVKPLQDNLRRQQRDAMVDYLLANPGIVQQGSPFKVKNENDLFAYLLIDVEMESCMKTSRLKQGISSLQLFMDRIILNLESYFNGSTNTAIQMSEDAAVQWHSWRKWYRIWEANRKVFLYPENWIEPELRDKKTSLFKELESHLLQDEITDNRVEEGFKNYLEGLDAIARLEPVSAYHQTSHGKDILHVFARTDSDPQRYFYRTREDNEWSEWQRVAVDIKSQHIAPVMWNNKLYLFWLTFQKKKLNVEEAKPSMRGYTGRKWSELLTLPGAVSGNGSSLVNDPEKDKNTIWNVTLNWSQYQDQKWLSHDLSKDVMELDLSKIEVNDNAVNSLNTPDAAQTLRKLTNNGMQSIDEFFKKRIFLYTPYDFTVDTKDGVIFNLLFAPGLNEVATGLHTFLWKGDNSRDPYVLRDSDRGHQTLAPTGTRFNNMKFVQDTSMGVGLKKDTAYANNRTGYYTHSTFYYWPSGVSMIRTNGAATILGKSPTPFRLTAAATTGTDTMFDPIKQRFFFEDEVNSFLVEDVANKTMAQATISSIKDKSKISLDVARLFSEAQLYSGQPLIATNATALGSIPKATAVTNPNGYKFQTFYHAQSSKLISSLNRGGIPELLTLANQSQTDTMNFAGTYQPSNLVNSLYPKNNMQFGFSDPYSMYNWELFFHAPMMIAQGLSNNQQFAEAQKWYHYIFNPTSTAGPNTNQRFWKFQPFFEKSGMAVQTLNDLLLSIHNNNAEAVAQVKKWEKDPFNPHLIARMRILSYMKNVLMKYLDNLIAWADNLFQRDTIESINEATQLYVLAANLLGERPRQIPARVKRNDYTFKELSAFGLDQLSNAMVTIESFFAPNDAPGVAIYNTGSQQPGLRQKEEAPVHLQTLYFCLPNNDKLMQYWDNIADRLFKIRNCMNIDGATRQLALYEPPIDPALLVRAKAMGLSMESVLNELYGSGKPFYRFGYMVQKANEILGDVKSLGGAILSALEKKDAEALSLLRSVHELDLLDKIKEIKTQQIEEATRTLDGLRLTKTNTQIRYDFYSSRPFKNANEQKHLDKIQSAMTFQVIQGALQTTAGVLSAIPTFHLQAIASGLSSGGLQWANIMQAASAATGIKVAVDNAKGSMAVTSGGYERRRDDWQFQAKTAAKELETLEQQILAAEIRLDITRKELRNHEIQIENSTAVDTYMRNKFTNVALYNWMTTQLASTYFQSYQLAYELSKQADTCFQSELPAGKYPAGGFIKYGYWDSLKKGLLSGEKLQLDIRRMETAYMEANERELELTKHISLAVFSPESIIQLRQTGTCTVSIPEVLFDLDYPGHYMRRIKSVSLSVPCVAGPYTTINAQLTQESSKFRKSPIVSGLYDADLNYTQVNNSNRIATSSAQNDSGVFELNFRDERYLPFEGTGAIATWTISFPKEYRQFDYNSINDIILHLKYTARYDGVLQQQAQDNINTVLSTLNEENILHRYFSAKHEFSNNWFAYAKNFESNSYARLVMEFDRSTFPFFCKDKKISIETINLSLNAKEGLSGTYTARVTYTASSGYKTVSTLLNSANSYTGALDLQSFPIEVLKNKKLIQLSLEDSSGNPVDATALLDDLFVVFDYRLNGTVTAAGTNDIAQEDIVNNGLAGWWHATGKGNIVSDSSGEVSLLKDLSGKNRDFIYLAGSSTMPILFSPNGIQTISFSNNMFCNGANGDTIGRAESFTAFFIGSCGFGRGINYFGGNNNFNYFSHYYNDGGFSIILQQPAPEEGYGITNEFFTRDFLAISLDQNNTSTLKVYDLSGNVHDSLSISKSVLRPSNIGLTLGAGAEFGYINGHFYELLVYNRTLSQTEIKSVLAYLKSKYPFLN
ncbi:hypothetical protein DBR32_11160 [Taibaiella sp. KBW10]|uniref:Tc toxin subunit A-related protein n=1 Tax=Taibaiella sp. KBW10 TaxID=2153357 RepID=UPI000F5AA74E|nr:neuraminidase-like domain-containing protein [Taibaiella sp. KBW10]RQO30137.1 hypothetical protein DBR32_11160 [Taibaiella sp. KBW10]